MNFLLIFRPEAEKITNFWRVQDPLPVPAEKFWFLFQKGLDRGEKIRYTLSIVSLC